MTTSLEQHRKQASDQSLGASHQQIYEKAEQLLIKHCNGKKHLDFGSGQGSFLKQLHHGSLSLQLSGADLMAKPKDVDSEINWIQADLNGKIDVANESFDSISALEIIEHLENPRHVFREIYRLLKPNGILIMSTPNNESWRAILSYMKRGHFVAFTDQDYPAHITPLNRKDLLRAADEAGFKCLGWDFPKKGALPVLTNYSWQGMSMGLLKGLRYSDNIFIILQK